MVDIPLQVYDSVRLMAGNIMLVLVMESQDQYSVLAKVL